MTLDGVVCVLLLSDRNEEKVFDEDELENGNSLLKLLKDDEGWFGAFFSWLLFWSLTGFWLNVTPNWLSHLFEWLCRRLANVLVQLAIFLL